MRLGSNGQGQITPEYQLRLALTTRYLQNTSGPYYFRLVDPMIRSLKGQKISQDQNRNLGTRWVWDAIIVSTPAGLKSGSEGFRN